MHDDDDAEDPPKPRLVSWESIRGPQLDPWGDAAFERLAMMERMLLHVCHARGVNEQTVMDALGTEPNPYVEGETFVPIEFKADDEGLYIALVGRAIAAMGGHLELRAVFPDQEFLLLCEPGPEHIDDGVMPNPHGFKRAE